MSILASYQVSLHLAERFQRRRLKCEKLTDETKDAKAHIAFGKVVAYATTVHSGCFTKC